MAVPELALAALGVAIAATARGADALRGRRARGGEGVTVPTVVCTSGKAPPGTPGWLGRLWEQATVDNGSDPDPVPSRLAKGPTKGVKKASYWAVSTSVAAPRAGASVWHPAGGAAGATAGAMCQNGQNAEGRGLGPGLPRVAIGASKPARF